LEYPKYSCHENRFTIFHPTIMAVVPSDIISNVELAVFGKIIMVNLQFVQLH
jgi:hypothetical protein